MTEEQIKTACIEYCRLAGLDPFERGLFLFDSEFFCSRWESYKEEVIHHYRLTQAIKHAQEGFKNE